MPSFFSLIKFYLLNINIKNSGKSTILQLIEHFYEPSKGRIILDGVDIKDLCLESLRRSIGYVSQEPNLFAATIRHNLRYAKPDASEEEMISALK